MHFLKVIFHSQKSRFYHCETQHFEIRKSRSANVCIYALNEVNFMKKARWSSIWAGNSCTFWRWFPILRKVGFAIVKLNILKFEARLRRCLALLYKRLFNVNSELQNVKFYCGKTNFSDDGNSRPANLHFIRWNDDDFGGKSTPIKHLSW